MFCSRTLLSQLGLRWITCILLLVAVSLQTVDAREPRISRDQFAQTMEEIFETVLEKHIEPPTRQELVLALIRRLHHRQSPDQLAKWADTVSNVGGKESLYKLMRAELEKSDAWAELLTDRAEIIDLSWLAGRLAGGIQLQSVKNVEVEKQLAANRYVGIGVQMTTDKSKYVFLKVLENGTAAEGGIKELDNLLKINGVEVTGSLDSVVESCAARKVQRCKSLCKPQ